MKRSPELTPLSRDHHKALSAAQRLSRAEDEAAACRELLDFWTSHGSRHFQIEEDVLLPAWLELDPAADGEMAARTVREHLEIRTAVRRARHSDSDLNDLRAVGKLLADHVRFEERELFPLIESRLDSASLADLGREIDAAEATRPSGSES
jgi:hemerythrin-like domain-containing protein